MLRCQCPSACDGSALGGGACREEGRDHLALCYPLLGPLVTCSYCSYYTLDLHLRLLCAYSLAVTKLHDSRILTMYPNPDSGLSNLCRRRDNAVMAADAMSRHAE